MYVSAPSDGSLITFVVDFYLGSLIRKFYAAEAAIATITVSDHGNLNGVLPIIKKEYS